MSEQKEILEMSIDELRIEVAMLRERCAQLDKCMGANPQPILYSEGPYNPPYNPHWFYKVTCTGETS